MAELYYLLDCWSNRLAHKTKWPLWLRRVFILTLPVSYALWLVVCAIFFGFILVVFLSGEFAEYINDKVVSWFRKMWAPRSPTPEE